MTHFKSSHSKQDFKIISTEQQFLTVDSVELKGTLQLCHWAETVGPFGPESDFCNRLNRRLPSSRFQGKHLCIYY